MEESLKSEVLNHIAEVELIYKSKVKASERPKINHSKDAYIIFKNNWDENKIELQEQFKVMLLNKANKVLGIYAVSTGGMTGTVADPKLIFVAVLKAGACSIMLVHNHIDKIIDLIIEKIDGEIMLENIFEGIFISNLKRIEICKKYNISENDYSNAVRRLNTIIKNVKLFLNN
jgi:RadC-like JAB domain